MTKKVLFFLSLLLYAAVPLTARDTAGNSLKAFVEAVQNSSPRALQWQQLLLSEEYLYRSALGDKYPKINIGSSSSGGSSYSVTNSRTSGAAGEDEDETSILHAASAGIFISQELPTAGSVSLGIKDSISASIPEHGDTLITQAPEVSFSFTQPFAVNGRLIDPRLYSSKYDSSRVQIDRVRLQAKKGTNEAVLSGLTRLLNIEVLDRQITYTRAKIAILDEEIRILKLSEQQGRATPSEIWEKELERDTEKEQLLGLTHSREEEYFSLSLETGLEKEALTTLLPVIPGLPVLSPDREKLVDFALLGNPEIKQAMLDLDAAKHRTILAGAPYSPILSLSLSLAPQYPPGEDSLVTFSDSINRFDHDDAWNKLTGSVSFSIPIYPGGKPKYEILGTKAAEQAAWLAMQEQQLSITGNIDLIFLKRELLLERKNLYESSRELAEKKLTDTRRLLELNRATRLDLQKAEMQILYRDSQIYGVKTEIFLNDLKLFDLAGIDIAETVWGL